MQGPIAVSMCDKRFHDTECGQIHCAHLLRLAPGSVETGTEAEFVHTQKLVGLHRGCGARALAVRRERKPLDADVARGRRKQWRFGGGGHDLDGVATGTQHVEDANIVVPVGECDGERAEVTDRRDVDERADAVRADELLYAQAQWLIESGPRVEFLVAVDLELAVGILESNHRVVGGEHRHLHRRSRRAVA